MMAEIPAKDQDPSDLILMDLLKERDVSHIFIYYLICIITILACINF